MSTKSARADNTTIAAAPSNSPQSQIAVMQGNVATINPQGITARFVLADIKGKEAQAAFRTDVIRTAILELFKGNPRNLKEAVELTAQLGKGKKARAYAAGFEAVADARPLERVSARWMDEANADLRTQADTLADAYVLRFGSAHATVMAEKPAPKAKKEAAPAPQASDNVGSGATEGDNAGSTEADTAVDNALLIESALATVVTLAQQGMLTADQMATLRAALAVEDTVPDLLLIGSSSTSAPAHAH